MQITRHSLPFGIALLFAALALSACEKSTGQRPAPTVTYMEVKEGTATITSELPGRISAFYVSEVRPQVGGIIQKRLFTEGSMVQEGQVLYQIDPSLYQASYESAKANLARAEAALNASRVLARRYASLVKTKAVSGQEYDNAVAEFKSGEAEVLAAKAALETARINLFYTKVTAPISGRIGKSAVTEGALVTQNQAAPLATIQQLDKMYVDVSQSSYQVMDMQRRFGGKPKNDVLLRFQDGSVYNQKGSLEFYDVTVDPSTDMVNVRILFPNPAGLLLPGMYARAIITEGIDEHAVLIPQKTITKDQKGGDTVKVLTKEVKRSDDGREVETGLFTTVIRPIKTSGVLDINRVYVTDGLRPGELILVDGQQKAGAGVAVQATPASEESLFGNGTRRNQAANLNGTAQQNQTATQNGTGNTSATNAAQE